MARVVRVNNIKCFLVVLMLSAASTTAQYTGWNEGTGESSEEREYNLRRQADLTRQQADTDRIRANNADWEQKQSAERRQRESEYQHQQAEQKLYLHRMNSTGYNNNTDE